MSEARARTLISVNDLSGRLAAGSKVVLLHVRDEDTGKAIEGGVIPAPSTFILRATSQAPRPRLGASARCRTSPRLKPRPLVGRERGQSCCRLRRHIRRAGVARVVDIPLGRLRQRAPSRWRNRRVEGGGAQGVRQAVDAGGGSVTMTAGNMPTIEADEAQTLAREGVLFDARGKAAYVGAPAEPGKPASGHIPGAILAPSAGNIAADARFKPDEELRASLAAIGADGSKRIGVYCGSGNAAAHKVAALHAAGLEAALYVGSWSAWSADPDRPVAIGPEPG